ncbi:hypothetical protein D9V32_02165 [Mycetocola tolaasinivorans]|uniref:Uncharacterized protein n=1 Tax=Mycetocola tolaasinivorans TaxID=76635 RepID=A0A3L7ABV3_9MICO|nr:hypothetical protein D9V32_02165 [Mycetocola tolaasinivorans]
MNVADVTFAGTVQVLFAVNVVLTGVGSAGVGAAATGPPAIRTPEAPSARAVMSAVTWRERRLGCA